MSSQSQSNSRWGTFLQQAVAGVESRLDNILADEEATKGSAAHLDQAQRESRGRAETAKSTLNPPYEQEFEQRGSAGKSNNRLQERLAKAVVTRNAASISTSLSSRRSHAEGILESQSDTVSSAELKRTNSLSDKAGTQFKSHPSTVPDLSGEADLFDQNRALTRPLGSIPPRSPRTSLDSRRSKGVTYSSPPSQTTEDDTIKRSDKLEEKILHQGTAETSFHQLQQEHELLQLQKQDETRKHLEHIDTLQAKLQYLSRQARGKAQDAMREAGGDNATIDLARKDEKIALLMEEGQKLSQNELKLSTTLNRLRTKSSQDQSQISQLREVIDKLKNSQTALQGECSEAIRSKEAEQAHRITSEEDLERLRMDLVSKSSKIIELQDRLSKAIAIQMSGDNSKYEQELESEKRAALLAKEELSAMRVEQKLAAGKHREQVEKMQAELSQVKDRANTSDSNLRMEIRTLEGRLESYRARAEEFPSTTGKEFQAKLFRQVETLQSQYALASDNWRGIESSLMTRITSLEKDREDLSHKEADLRRKAREASSRCRSLEEDLEQAINSFRDQQEQLRKESDKSRHLKEALVKAEVDAKAAKDERDALTNDAPERRNMHKRVSADAPAEVLRTSPIQSFNIKSPEERVYGEKVNSSPRNKMGSPGLGLVNIPGVNERPMSRKASGAPTQGSFAYIRHDTSASILNRDTHAPSHTPPIQSGQQDEIFEGVVTPATPEWTINDIFSTSTAAAGPSVQLVERMSAAVRRLESEKAANKEEIENLTIQRNEAREQAVNLLREADEKRVADVKVSALESEIKSLNKRYQTTLEMLGEKSERVEELQADIVDMKQIYKDVLEKTVE